MHLLNFCILCIISRKSLLKPISYQQSIINYFDPLIIIGLSNIEANKLEYSITAIIIFVICSYNLVTQNNTVVSASNIFNLYCLLCFRIREFQMSQVEITQLVIIISSRIIQTQYSSLIVNLSSEAFMLILVWLQMDGHFTANESLLISFCFLCVFKLKDYILNPPEIILRKIFQSISLFGLIQIMIHHINYLRQFMSIMLLLTALIAMNDLPDANFDDEGQIVPKLDIDAEEPFSHTERMIRKSVFLLDKVMLYFTTMHGFYYFSQGSIIIFTLLFIIFNIFMFLISIYTNKEQYLQDNRIFGCTILITVIFVKYQQYLQYFTLFTAILTFLLFVKKLITLTQDQQNLNNDAARQAQSDFSNYFLLCIVISLVYLSTCTSTLSYYSFASLSLFIFYMQILSEMTVNGPESFLALFGLYNLLESLKKYNFTTERGVYHCLLTAAKSNQIRFFISLKSQISIAQNSGKESIAHAASEYGSLQILNFLIKNQLYQHFEKQKFEGKTPLDMAAAFSTPRIVKLLLQQNTRTFEVNLPTPLHFASNHGNYRVIFLLNKFVGRKDHNGRTALQCAAMHNYWKMIKYLDTEILIRDDFGRSARQVAALYQSWKIMNMLPSGNLDLVGNGDEYYEFNKIGNYFTDGKQDVFGRNQEIIQTQLDRIEQNLWK
ncbi:Ankyrin repeat-containing protein [Spironucleus salmonicida]|uniref:Ankyrin repeat-containing protein n=1 Tax=Spironucleus salmonicida TaxID=348837 RepID=V6LJS1_9EUKA|nr:Ankyrin repeat-containing protein [Spironucleus salmonicida]|eukprot:EST43966.1 Ankyrin repeat-containing protein [Spironucleus salmonicida]